MTNPNYAILLPQIAAESDPTAKQALIDQCYVFNTPLTESEQNLFNFMQSDYVENNPGNTDDSSSADSSTRFSAYAGVYFNNDGDTT